MREREREREREAKKRGSEERERERWRVESERWAFFLYYSLARVLSNVKIVQCDEILRLMLSFFFSV